jgi:peroxiredoxin
MSQLQTKNAAVLGRSADSVESHKRFVDKEHLNFPLLADTDKKMIAAYGVLAPAGYANRVTFVVGPDSRIREIDRAVGTQFVRDGGALKTRHGSNLALLLSDWKAHVGQPVPNFSLADLDGKTVSLSAPGKRVGVVLFLSARSPRSQAYADRIRELAADPAYKEVAFLALYPNADETAAAVREEADREKLGVPSARDAENQLADHFGTTVAPTAWVVDSKGIAVYSGAIDDSADPAHVTAHYLKDAIDAALAGRPVATPETKPSGTPIKRAAKRKAR